MNLADGQAIELLVVANRPAVVLIGADPDGTRPALAPCFRPRAESRQGIIALPLLRLSPALANVLLHPDIPGDGVFEREFDLVGEDDGHRSLLQHLERARFGEAVGGELFALERVDFVAESGEADFLAGRNEGERQAGRLADVGFRAHVRTRRRAATG